MNKNSLKKNGDPKLPDAHTAENVKKVHKLKIVLLWMISKAVISKVTVNTILNNDLKLHKIFAKFKPKILSEDQL